MPEPDNEFPDERQERYRNIPLADLEQVLLELMRTRRQTEIDARLDALTIYLLRYHR